MQPADYDEFVLMLNAVAELYSREQSSMAITLWWGALRNYDLPAVREGFDRFVRNPDNGQFMPRPADIIRMMGGTSQDSALSAWAKVDRAMRQVGPYRSVTFDDPVIHRVLHDMGGWIWLSQKGDEEWPFVAKQFENMYRGYRLRSETPAYPPVLIGHAEAHNAKAGHRSEPPTLIGDAAAAMRVYAGGAPGPILTCTMPDAATLATAVELRRLAA